MTSDLRLLLPRPFLRDPGTAMLMEIKAITPACPTEATRASRELMAIRRDTALAMRVNSCRGSD